MKSHFPDAIGVAVAAGVALAAWVEATAPAEQPPAGQRAVQHPSSMAEGMRHQSTAKVSDKEEVNRELFAALFVVVPVEREGHIKAPVVNLQVITDPPPLPPPSPPLPRPYPDL